MTEFMAAQIRNRKGTRQMKPVRMLTIALLGASIAVGCKSSTSGTTSGESSTPAARVEAPTRSTPARARTGLTVGEGELIMQSFDHVWATIRDKHFDASLNGVDWNEVKAELRPKIANARSASEARGVMNEMLNRLGQSHFGIIPADAYAALNYDDDASSTPDSDTPAAPETDKPAGSNGKSPSASKPGADKTAKPASDKAKSGNDKSAPAAPELPPEEPDEPVNTSLPGESGISIRVVDDKALVTRVEPNSGAAKVGIKPGWVVDSVRGSPVTRAIVALANVYPDRPGMREFILARSIEGRFGGNLNEKIEAVFLDGADRKVTRRVKLGKPSGNSAKFGNLPEMFIKFEARKLEGNVGYIHVSAFMDASTIMQKFQQAVESFADCDGVIIDLRGNPGGIGAMAMGMGGFFVTDSDLKLGTMKTRTYSLNFILNPRAKAFKGPLAILIDGASASTSEILAGGMQELGRARLFGTTSAGAALPSVIERLPNGDGFQYAFADYVTVKGNPLEARGVVPDEVVVPDRKALLAGRDNVVDAAITWIHAQKNSPK
jgi:carboxyl-terminal processing protease